MDEGSERIQHAGDVSRDLSRLGRTPAARELLATPGAREKSMAFLTKGYDEDPTKFCAGALFDENYGRNGYRQGT